MGMGGGNNFDASAAFKQERELLLLHRHSFTALRAERELLRDKHPAAVRDKGAKAGGAFLDVSK
jgi:hypothetical protein